jgi:hypothetical protein
MSWTFTYSEQHICGHKSDTYPPAQSCDEASEFRAVIRRTLCPVCAEADKRRLLVYSVESETGYIPTRSGDMPAVRAASLKRLTWKSLRGAQRAAWERGTNWGVVVVKSE